MTILAYITDVFYQAKVSQVVNGCGAKLKLVSSLYKFLPELDQSPDIVILDLNAEGINASTLITQVKLRKPDLPLIAYATEIDEDLSRRATKAGADQVLGRAEFTANLPQILTKCGESKK